MKCGDIAKAQQEFGIGAHHIPIDIRQRPGRTPTTAHRKNRAHRWVGIHGGDIITAFFILPSQIAIALHQIGRAFGHEAHRGNRLFNQREIKGIVAGSRWFN
jgi:hypothetical protein